jgi:hypothetical protein
MVLGVSVVTCWKTGIMGCKIAGCGVGQGSVGSQWLEGFGDQRVEHKPFALCLNFLYDQYERGPEWNCGSIAPSIRKHGNICWLNVFRRFIYEIALCLFRPISNYRLKEPLIPAIGADSWLTHTLAGRPITSNMNDVRYRCSTI